MSAIVQYTDSPDVYKAEIYLPGNPAPGAEDCILCGGGEGWGGIDTDPTTGAHMTPATGQHTGVVSMIRTEDEWCDWSHLRCLLDCAEAGILTLMVGLPEDAHGRHAAGSYRVVTAERSVCGQSVVVPGPTWATD